jgi:hypothetical protein
MLHHTTGPEVRTVGGVGRSELGVLVAVVFTGW